MNAILVNKLNMAQHYLKDAFMLGSPSECPPSEQQFLVTACLNVIGAYDSRPRVGAVANVDGSLGTVVRVTQKGKFCVQLHHNALLRKVSVSSLKLVPDIVFLLDKMPLNDHLVKIWAGLIMNKSTGSYLNTERKAAYGKSSNSPIRFAKCYVIGQINVGTLRMQQNVFSALNAMAVLNKNQYRLRKVLKLRENFLDQSEEQQSIEEEINQQPVLLIQKLLTKAVQPSPLKPRFSIHDMQLAVLNLTQYLAAECNLEQPPLSFNNDKFVNKALPSSDTMREVVVEAASPNSECSFKSVVSEKKKKKRKKESSQSSPSPLVTQIMEMGFSKKSVENAIKSLGM